MDDRIQYFLAQHDIKSVTQYLCSSNRSNSKNISPEGNLSLENNLFHHISTIDEVPIHKNYRSLIDWKVCRDDSITESKECILDCSRILVRIADYSKSSELLQYWNHHKSYFCTFDLYLVRSILQGRNICNQYVLEHQIIVRGLFTGKFLPQEHILPWCISGYNASENPIYKESSSCIEYQPRLLKFDDTLSVIHEFIISFSPDTDDGGWMYGTILTTASPVTNNSIQWSAKSTPASNIRRRLWFRTLTPSQNLQNNIQEISSHISKAPEEHHVKSSNYCFKLSNYRKIWNSVSMKLTGTSFIVSHCSKNSQSVFDLRNYMAIILPDSYCSGKIGGFGIIPACKRYSNTYNALVCVISCDDIDENLNWVALLCQVHYSCNLYKIYHHPLFYPYQCFEATTIYEDYLCTKTVTWHIWRKQYCRLTSKGQLLYTSGSVVLGQIDMGFYVVDNIVSDNNTNVYTFELKNTITEDEGPIYCKAISHSSLITWVNRLSEILLKICRETTSSNTFVSPSRVVPTSDDNIELESLSLKSIYADDYSSNYDTNTQFLTINGVDLKASNSISCKEYYVRPSHESPSSTSSKIFPYSEKESNGSEPLIVKSFS